MKCEDLLEQKMKNALTSSPVPEEELNRKIIAQIRGMEQMKARRKMRPMAIAAVMVLVMAVTSFAAVKLWSPQQVSEKFGYDQLAKAFESEDAVQIDQTVRQGGYDITLMGTVSGKELGGMVAKKDSTYAVVAIANADGTPIPGKDSEEYLNDSFFISPLIQGLKPWLFNIATMDGGYTEEVIDGVRYRLIECDNVEMFADHQLYLCVSSTIFYDVDVYNYDEITGEITPREGFDGVNVLFNLPLDPSKADPEKAAAYVKELLPEDDGSDTTVPGVEAEPEEDGNILLNAG